MPHSQSLTYTRITVVALSFLLLGLLFIRPEQAAGKNNPLVTAAHPPDNLSANGAAEIPALFAAQRAASSQPSLEVLLVTQHSQMFPLWSKRAFAEPDWWRARLTASAKNLPMSLAPPSACTSGGYTITPRSNDTIYVDCNDAQTSSYIAYQITNNTGSNVADLWVKLTGSTNILVNEDGLYHVGVLANGASTTVYFYVDISPCDDYTAQNLTVNVFTAPPAPIGSATSVASCTRGYAVTDDISANANKITVVTTAPNPPVIGGCLTIQARGFTGNIGNDGLFAPTAASLPGWPADTYKLIDTTITFYNSPSNESGCDFTGAPTSTYNDTLIIDPPLAQNSMFCYQIDYKFIIEEIETTPTAVSPSTWISSGNPTKHNDTITPAPSPIPTPTNAATLAKTASPTSITSGATVTYTVTVTNTSSVDVFLNSFRDVLPTGFTYVTSSSQFNSLAIPDPTISSQTLTWSSVFMIPASGSRSLVYQATAPTFSGCVSFTNSAVAFVGIGESAVQIDTTLATNDNVPATATVTGGNDTEDPVITCPAGPITANAAQGTCAANVEFTVTATDNCSTPTVVCVPASGSSFTVGTTQVNCTATDASGRTDECSFNVVVSDTQLPTISCPANITVDAAQDTCAANASFTVTAMDNCPGVTFACTANGLPVSSGASFPVGTTTVTCEAIDTSGNRSGECSFTVTVRDTQAPTLTCPANITTSNAPGACNAVVNYTTPTGSDNCDTSVTVTCLPASGSTFNLGTTTVTCTASDDSPDSADAMCSFTVTVNDTEKPTLTCPTNVVVDPAVGTCTAVVNYTPPTGSDNCDDSVAVSCLPAPGSTFNVGTTTVTCTAADDANNSQQCSFTVTVNPCADLAITKTNDASSLAVGGTTTYTIVVTNNGPSAANGAVFTDPAVAGLSATSVTCGNATGGAVCPASGDVTVANMLGTGIIIPTLPAGGSVTFLVTANVTATSGSVTNTATISPPNGTTDPDPDNNTRSDTDTLTSLLADLKISKTDGVTVVSTGAVVTYAIVIRNDGPTAADGAIFTDPAVAGLNITSVTCGNATGGASCPASGDVTVANMQGAGITIPMLPAGGSVTFTVIGTITATGGEVTNTAIVALPEGIADPTTPNRVSDTDTLSNLTVSDQRAGSLLFFPIYTSSISNPASENTRINITNTDETNAAAVHLFFVDGETCSVADNYICLTPNQTTSFLASDVDPGVMGYIVAVAVDVRTGCPINFNQLTGDEYVKFQSGHAANLGAEAFPAIDPVPAVCDDKSQTAELAFDGLHYAFAPRVLALDSIASPTENNSTMLILNRLGGDLQTSGARLGSLFGILYDQLENPYSFTASGGCQLKRILDSNFPRTSPRISTVIPGNASGWMKLWATEDFGLLGVMLNFNPTAATNPGAYNQGHNLHKLTYTNKAKLTIPVFAPNCR